MHCADNLAMYLGNFNGHIGRHTDGFDVVHRGMIYVRGILKKECY